jgi:hypothetical protein
VHPDVEELKPKLKEVLYDCAVTIRATKAALYVFDGTSKFELATEYGFRGGVRQVADFNDPIVDRCGRGRTPFYVNGLAAEPRFSELLYEASTDRLLAAPLYSRGKLVGLIDMRDKAAKAPFDNEDIAKAQSIAERLVDVFGERNLFGHRFIALSADPERPAARPAEVVEPPQARPAPPAPPPEAPAPAPPAPADTVPAERAHLPRLAPLVIDAREAAARLLTAPDSEPLSQADVDTARDALRAVLLIPGAVAATFSAFGHLGGVQEIAARAPMAEEAKNLLQSKLQVWLAKRGENAGFVHTSVATPLGTAGPNVVAADIQKVFTAPLQVRSLRGLYLTVVFSGTPDRVAHELLAVLHAHLQLLLEQSVRQEGYSQLQARIAARLVEPEFATFRELRRHSELVSRLSEQFARHIGLTEAEAETARIAGLVHDCGLRLLDYERLYDKRELTAEELAFLREHPHVGAAIVEPLLGTEIAKIVLCHHERPDGRGYPNQMRGDDIPLLSRVIQLCDAWVAMTDEESYRFPASRETALGSIARSGGLQFDAELTPKFVQLIRGMR